MTQGVFLKTLFFYVECFPKRSASATLPSSWILSPFSHMRFGVFTCESHQDLGIFAYVQPLYSHLCLLSHTCEYLLSYENRCWCDHKYFNISESVKFFKVLISVPKLDRKAWIFPTFFFVKILKFSKKSHICEAQEPHMWLYSHMWVRTVSLTVLYYSETFLSFYPIVELTNDFHVWKITLHTALQQWGHQREGGGGWVVM